MKQDSILLIKDILYNDVGVPQSIEITPDISISDGGLELDSIRFLKFLSIIEKKTFIRLEDKYWDMKYITTLKPLIDYINEYGLIIEKDKD